MTVLEKVRRFLVAMAPKAACDDCIAEGLKLSVRQHANHKTVVLERQADFYRGVGACAVCKRVDKKVIRYRSARADATG